MSGIKRPVPLLVSLALNFALIGLVAGLMLNRPSHDERRGPRHDRGDRIELSVQSREAVRNAFRASREAAEEARIAHAEAQKTLHDTLTAPVFDADAAEVAFATLREREGAIRGAVQSRLIEEMADLSVAERTRIAQRLSRGPRRR